MARRINISPNDDLKKLIKKYQEDNNLPSLAGAAATLCAIGAETVYGTRPQTKQWGGHRQCPQCNGYNLGTYKNSAICADCGWKEGDNALT